MSWQPGLTQVWEGEFPEPSDLELVDYGLPPALVNAKERDDAYLKREATSE